MSSTPRGRPEIPSTPTSLTDLITLAESAGLAIVYEPCLPHHGRYYRDRGEIRLQPGMTERANRSLLAHELGHAWRGDEGPCQPAAERAAWRIAARLLIDPHEYRIAERIHGPGVGALAAELGVTTEVVEAWQSAAHDGALWTTCEPSTV